MPFRVQAAEGSAPQGIVMNVVICPREWTHSRERFEPTHMVSIQDPGANVAHLRPPWVPAENHFICYFQDGSDPNSPGAPTRQLVQSLTDWLAPRCARGSTHRILIHCNAGMSRSPAVGYLAWALHLGPGRENEAYQRMLWSCVRPFVSPNPVVVDFADDILSREGALGRPLNRWAGAAPRTARNS